MIVAFRRFNSSLIKTKYFSLTDITQNRYNIITKIKNFTHKRRFCFRLVPETEQEIVEPVTLEPGNDMAFGSLILQL